MSAGCALVLAMAAAAGCGTPPPDLVGRAALDAPIVGATMTIEDPSGRVLYSQQTGESGTFRIWDHLGLTGHDFRVVVTGGTYQGQPFTDTLRRDVESYDAASDLLYVNAVTTLVSRYHERHPELSLALAGEAIKRFLVLAPHADPGAGVDNPYQQQFSHATFLAAAPAGSTAPVADVVEATVAELDAGVARHAYVAATLPELPGLDVLTKNLAGMVADESFGFLFSSILGYLGLGGTTEIIDLLQQISAQLSKIETSLRALEGDIDQQTVQIEQLRMSNYLRTISNTFEKLRLLAVDARFRCLRDPKTGQPVPGCEICHTDGSGTKTCTNPEEKLQAAARALRSEILARGGVSDALVIVRQQMVKPQISNGILEAWNTYFETGVRFKQPVHNPAMDELALRYQALQLMATAMVIEALRASDNVLDRQDAATAMADHQTAVAQQTAKVAGFYARAGTLEDRKDYAEGSQHRVWQYQPVRVARRNEAKIAMPVFARVQAYCDKMRAEHTFGYANWRPPTEKELRRIVDDAPANADLFEWMVKQGFAPDDGWGHGFERGNNAYYSMDYELGAYAVHWPMALWHDGVNWACDYADYTSCLGQHDPDDAFAWCTTDTDQETHQRCDHVGGEGTPCPAGYACEEGDECIRFE